MGHGDGTRWEPANDGPKIKQWLSAVSMLEAGSSRWRSLPDYPLPAGYAFAAGVAGKLYVTGGRGASRGNAETYVLDLSRPDPQWQPGPPLPEPRWEPVGAAIGGILYIAGGSTGDLSRADGPRLAPQVLALDTGNPDAGWKRVAELPNPQIMYPVCAACGGRLFFFGGAVATPDPPNVRPVDEAYAYDLAGGTWKTIRPLPAAAYSGAALALDDRRILIAGGGTAVPALLTPDGKARLLTGSECFLYDTVSDSYSRLQPLPEGVCDQGLVLLKGEVYCIGGEQTPLKTRTDVTQVGRIRIRK